MLIVADAHVHFYPCHDRDAWVDAAARHLRGDARILALTERHDCHAFRDNAFRGDRIDAETLRVETGGQPLYVLAGRQIVTRERLEVLALGCDTAMADGQPIRDALARARDAGGIPVLAWAPGKWFFRRGKVVVGVLDAEPAGSLLIGDSSLRPTLWPEPDLMTYAHQKGFHVVAGSDPLPVPGEEAYVGTYGIACEGDFDEARPAASMKRLFLDPASEFMTRGRRCGPWEVFARLRRHKKTGRRSPAQA